MKFKIVLLIFDPEDTFASTPEALPKTLSSIRQLRGNFELVIVFNSPVCVAPKTFEFLVHYQRCNPQVFLVQQEKKQGISVGLNTGASQGDPDYDILIMMSGDALIVDPDILIEFEFLFSKYPKIGCLHSISIFEDSPNLCNYSSDFTMQCFHNHLNRGTEHCLSIESNILNELPGFVQSVKNRKQEVIYPLPTLPLTFFAVRSRLFKTLSGFDEAFLCGHENNDFIVRALKTGYYAAAANRAFIYHRRLFFRILGQAGKNRSIYNQLAGQSARAWKSKYGNRDILETFYEIRFGSFFAKYLLPIAKITRQNLKKIFRKSNLLKIFRN